MKRIPKSILASLTLALVSFAGYMSIWLATKPTPSPTPASADEQITSIQIIPDPINVPIGTEISLSSMAYNPSDLPLYDTATYQWGISSSASIGIISSNQNTATFTAINPGTGDLWVTAQTANSTFTKSIPVTITSTDPIYGIDIHLDHVEIIPESITTTVGENIYLSTMAYNPVNKPLYSIPTYTWGISSTNSIGTLSANQNIATFKAQKPGTGDLWVQALGSPEATPQSQLKSIPITIFSVADFEKDSIVDVSDYSILVNNFLTSDPATDLNHDGIVDLTDYSLFVIDFTNFLSQ